MNQLEFTKLILPFQDKLYRLAKRILISTDEAEDATQEVVLKLWTNKNKIKEYTNVEAYSMMMIKNYCFDKLKAKSTQNLKLVHSNYTDTTTVLDQQIEAKNSVEWVSKLIEELPEKQKLILQLRDIEQFTLEEIAKMLEINNTAVRVNLSRARKAIRKKLIQTHNYGVS